jgi:hypothetical protein
VVAVSTPATRRPPCRRTSPRRSTSRPSRRGATATAHILERALGAGFDVADLAAAHEVSKRTMYRAAVEPVVAERGVTELETDGLFQVERCDGDGGPCWQVG